MATNVHLTTELERFARGCVESGRYNNVSEVMRSALRLLQDQELRREAFARSLQEAQEEADRDGAFTMDQVLGEMDAIIAAADGEDS